MAPQAATSAPIVSDVCGLVLPGYPMLHAWKQLSSTKLSLCLYNKRSQLSSMSTTFPQSQSAHFIDFDNIHQLTLFLLPGAENKLPPQSALALYYSTTEPYDLWTILGAVSIEKPSAVFSVNWGELNKGEAHGKPHIQIIKLGLSIEPLEGIRNLEQNQSIERSKEREDFGLKIAQDLYNFMGSFSQATHIGEQLVGEYYHT